MLSLAVISKQKVIKIKIKTYIHAGRTESHCASVYGRAGSCTIWCVQRACDHG